MVESSSSFWLSDLGLKIRIEEFSRLIVVRTYNRAMQMYAPDAGVKMFRYTTMGDNRVCQICMPRDGREYRAGMFMPFLPQHFGCRCVYDIMIGVV